ncbi:MAG TPA: sensor histidine kinase [Symbiobacteriaceae bacterium]|nr:sensor histidine kinase [Symbiobacteriaceae bacterium]
MIGRVFRWWQRRSLVSQVGSFATGLVLCSFTIGLALTGYNLLGAVVNELGRRAMSVARTVAQVEELRRNLGQPGGSGAIQPVVERMRLSTGVEYIVAFDMNRIRYADPLAERIGRPFEGGDEGPSLSQQAYVSQAMGVNGRAVRAFVPVLSPAGTEQVGVVVVGIMAPPLVDLLKQFLQLLPLGVVAVAAVGVGGSWILATGVKRQMFNLEPAEIAHRLEERVAVVAALSEGLVAIAEDGTITVLNEEAQRITGVGREAIGRSIFTVAPNSGLPETIRTGQAEYNQQTVLGNRFVVVNRVPVRIKDRIVGAVATFRERTEVHRLAEELTGVTRFVDALRAQNHESLNKLHTIAGLIHMREYEKALDYIYTTTDQQEEASRFLARQIRDYRVSGLLLGKVIRGRELGIDLHIDPHSQLNGIPGPLDGSDLVLLLGNLIENAMEALTGQAGERRVDCLIRSDSDRLLIRVADNGPGVPPDLQEQIFVHGFSTKGDQRGLGLALIRQMVTLARGRVELRSEPGRTVFTILVGEAEGDAD